MAILGLELSAGSHDLVLKNGRLQVVSERGLIARNLKSRLQMIKGEWILNKNYGFDFNVIFKGRSIDMQALEKSLKTYILATEGVLGIVVFILEYDGKNERKLSLTLSVKTAYSEEEQIGGITIG